MRARRCIAVIGAGSCDDSQAAAAEDVGRLLARAGALLVCGGLGGVMEAACRGAKAEGGTTVGILPGLDRGDANQWVDVAIPTGLGEARNVLVVRATDALIAIGGEFGTLSEIAFALKTGKPVVGLGTWVLVQRPDAIVQATNAAEAVSLALGHAKG
ncbi:MAG TPA: TIGR00725 family protein [Myxococcales bacterium]|nr:TIGR00725 family protein [Myxococcales bacterium]